MASRSQHRRGFTLVEILVAAGISGIAILGAFSFARYQITAYKTQGEISDMQMSSNIVFESMARDLRSSGFGSSFWIGAEANAFGDTNRLAFGDRGIPSVRPMNGASPNGSGNAAMPRSDALMIVRMEGEATHIPSGEPGAQKIPAQIPNGSTYLVANPAALAGCANTDIDGVAADEDGLVVVSDMGHRAEPASFMLEINPFVAPPVGTAGSISFGNTWSSIDPGAGSRVGGAQPPIVPTGAGIGSLVVCVRPVVYWVDAQFRLRMWRASNLTLASSGSLLPNAGDVTFTVPINPTNDLVLAEGVEDLQIAYLMSGAAGAKANLWIYSSPTGAASSFADAANLAEIRAVRITALLRTAVQGDTPVVDTRPTAVEDHTVPTTECVNIGETDCYNPRFRRKTITFQAELRNMRLFDLMSSTERTTDQIRSYLP